MPDGLQCESRADLFLHLRQAHPCAHHNVRAWYRVLKRERQIVEQLGRAATAEDPPLKPRSTLRPEWPRTL
jgi:hypothetical protein